MEPISIKALHCSLEWLCGHLKKGHGYVFLGKVSSREILGTGDDGTFC